MSLIKKILALIVIIPCRFTCYSQDNGIRFLENPEFKMVLEMAAKQNKPIFIDCYTNWCGICKQLDKKVFNTKEAGDYFNGRFINVKYNMESPQGKSFNSTYRIGFYPTCLFLDTEGKLVHYEEGFIEPIRLIEAGTKARSMANKVEGAID